MTENDKTTIMHDFISRGVALDALHAERLVRSQYKGTYTSWYEIAIEKYVNDNGFTTHEKELVAHYVRKRIKRTLFQPQLGEFVTNNDHVVLNGKPLYQHYQNIVVEYHDYTHLQNIVYETETGILHVFSHT